MMVEFLAIKTRVLIPPKDDLLAAIEESELSLAEGDIVLISSKVLAIHQGRCVKKTDIDKLEIIQQEADAVLGPISDPCLTIKDRAFVPNSGVDESNGGDYYILWPQNIGELLREIHTFLCEKFQLSKLGIISVDSHVLPMRAGTVGISQASFGFLPIREYAGQQDLFGRKLMISRVNIADCLAAMSPVMMGEGRECCPIVVVRGLQGLTFSPIVGDLSIPDEQDLFAHLLRNKK